MSTRLRIGKDAARAPGGDGGARPVDRRTLRVRVAFR